MKPFKKNQMKMLLTQRKKEAKNVRNKKRQKILI